jgi:hypothetical protein
VRREPRGRRPPTEFRRSHLCPRSLAGREGGSSMPVKEGHNGQLKTRKAHILHYLVDARRASRFHTAHGGSVLCVSEVIRASAWARLSPQEQSSCTQFGLPPLGSLHITTMTVDGGSVEKTWFGGVQSLSATGRLVAATWIDGRPTNRVLTDGENCLDGCGDACFH